MSALPYAPGQRIIVRDTEWVVRRVDLLADGGYKLTCEGISPFVKGKESIFLTGYEKGIQIIDLSKTILVTHDTQRYQRSLLYIESLLRELAPYKFDSVLRQNENETCHDINGCIIFTVSKGLTGVGLLRKARKDDRPCKIVIDGEVVAEKPLGWEDIAGMTKGGIHRTITDDTMPSGPCERTIVYKAPFAKCDREENYEIAWREFEKRRTT